MEGTIMTHMLQIQYRDLYRTGTDTVIVPLNWQRMPISILHGMLRQLDTNVFQHPYIVKMHTVTV